MRAFQTAFFVCALSLSDVVLAIPAVSSTITVTSSVISILISTTPLSTTTVQASNLATTINTINVSSFMTSHSSALPSSSGVASSNSSINENPPSMSSSSTSTQNATSDAISHRTLVIVLSSVLGFIGLVLLLGAIFLVFRFSRGQAPFRHRGASPINDDEIESWRRSGREKLPISPPDYGPAIREVTSLPMHSPGWTWEASPTSIRTISANMSEPHSVVAKAPNARAGLTDETLPGADPFITPPKRQSSRLSKAPPGHARTKSRRSSISAKSMWSSRERSSSDLKAKDRQSTWYDQDDEVVSSHIRTDNGSSSPGASDIFDGMSSGGLSPRPKSRPRLYEISREDIGRAIA